MKTERKIMAAALALGLAIWVVDAIQDYLFFYEGSFWELFIADMPPHEFIVRGFLLVCSLVFGTIVACFVRERREREEKLNEALVQAERGQSETTALLKATQEVLKQQGFADAARAIFDYSREVIGAPAGYISLANADGTENDVVFLEPGGLSCSVDPSTPMPIRGLRAEAYQEGRAIYDNTFFQSEYTNFLPPGHVRVDNVLFAPLLLQGKPVGLLGLANKPGGFCDHDAVLAAGFAELAAIALVNKRQEEERGRLIEELQTEKTFLNSVVEQMPAGVTIAEAPTGKLILGNKELKNTWHWDDLPADLKEGWSQVQIFQEDGEPYLFEEWPLVRSLEYGETVIGKEADVVRKDGSRCTLRVSSAPIRDSQGQVKAAVATCIDITGRKLAEEALKENREMFRQMAENIRDVFFMRDAKTGKLRYISPAYEHIWGRSCESLYENPLSFLEAIHPDDRDGVRGAYDKHSQGLTYHQEHRIIRPDGEIGWVWVRGFPIRDDKGEVYRVAGIAEDITERKRAQEDMQRAHDELERRVQGRTLALSRTVEQLRVEIEEREKAEARLRDSEARFRTLLQTAGSYIVTMTPDGRIIEFNQEAERVTGWKRHELEGKTGLDLFLSKEARAIAEAEMAKLVAGEILRSFELPIRLKDGSERVYLWNANVICGYGSQPMEIIAVGQDITERKQAEEALREQSRILEAFFEHTITPLVFLDREFKFIRVNKAYARACHCQVSEFPSRNFFDFFPDEENQALFLSVMKSKTPYQVLAQPFVFPDHPEWGVSYWDWTLVPVLDDPGEVDFLVLSLNDVTQKVLAEEKKAQLHEIIEATPDLVGTADTEGRIFYINQAGRRMIGIGPDEDLSRASIADVHPPGISELIQTQAISVSRQEGVWRGETKLLSRDGREIPISQVILAHRTPEGGVKFYSTIARDISDMKRAEKKLRMLTSRLLTAQESERRRLSRELHDELGQSLLVLKMQARALERQLPEGQEILREDCQRALKYIDEIIENVRRLSRDLSPSILEDLGLSAALNYLFEEFRRHHEGIKFIVEQERVDEYISKEEQINIFRIFQESLTNIGKHARATQVRVSLRKEENMLVGKLADNGVGFDLNEVMAREGLDKGLGLEAMDERLRIIGGSLQIVSWKGKGTSIAFQLPLANRELSS